VLYHVDRERVVPAVKVAGDDVEQVDWARIQTLFEAALALPVEQRDVYLQKQDGSKAIIEDVRDLLEAHISAENLWQNSPPDPSLLSVVSDDTATLPAGHVIGQHQIQEKIGVGGMGVIYRALDSRLQRQVVLKFLPNHMHSAESARKRFMAEARAASRLDHPNICVIHDVGETDEGHMYITMPFYEGETLAAKISRGPIAVDDAIDIAIQVGAGLASAHEHDIVHRDIKPANIMLTDDGLIKILDFGVAKVADANLTGTGMCVGTVAYMAPEQLNGDPIDARIDIWAVGAILYEMLSGKSAVPGKGLQQIVKSMFNDKFDPVAMLPDHISPELCAVLRNALQRDRDARYATMTEMLNELTTARSSIYSGVNTRRQESSSKAKQENAGYEWDDEFIDAVVDMLMPWLGPITPKMVRHYARVSATLDNFIQCLEDVLPSDEARKSFCEKIKVKASMHTSPPAPLAVGDNDVNGNFELSPVQIVTLEKMMLAELGPIAAILIRRVAANVTNWDALCDQLSHYFNSLEASNKFLRDVAYIEHNE